MCRGGKLGNIFLCYASVHVVILCVCGRRGMWREYEDCAPWSAVCEVCGDFWGMIFHCSTFYLPNWRVLSL